MILIKSFSVLYMLVALEYTDCTTEYNTKLHLIVRLQF